VIVNSTVGVIEYAESDEVYCSITAGSTPDFDYLQGWQSSGPTAGFAQLAGTRTSDFGLGRPIAAGFHDLFEPLQIGSVLFEQC
jgi:hypothetical protein